MQAVRQAVHVKQRQRRQIAVGAGDSPSGDEREGVGREIALRKDRAVGGAGRARGVDERHRRVGIGGHGDARRGLRSGFGGERGDVPDGHFARDQRGEIRRRHDGRGRGVVHDVREFAFSVEDVDRHDDQTEFRAREPEVDDLDAILKEKRETVARLESARAQQLREAITANFQVAKRVRGDDARGALTLKRGPRGTRNQGHVKQGQKRHGDDLFPKGPG